MKWELIQPKKGDIIRVSFGNFYHYGIYVTDDEVIQFGLSPTLNVGLKEQDVKVLSSDIDVFLNGGFLEVAVLDKKEEKTRASVDDTVKKARSRIGETGYHLLYNNCEHFVNSCVFNNAFCSATDNARSKILSIPVLNVYVAQIPKNGNLSSLIPKERNDEVISCKNDEVKREKYYVWKLLEYALERTFGKKMKKLTFAKTDYGKWTCDNYEFSLSHSCGTVAVAVSRKNVGVDIEEIKELKIDISEKILSQTEMVEYGTIDQSEKNDWLLKKWTQKESVFKTLSTSAYSIKDINTDRVKTMRLKVGEKEYFLSVCSKCIDSIKLFSDVDLTKM
jgi:phosphopantetheine--protein transferase-like protein